MIGVFDSGHGGLTILRTLVARLPRESFVYLGDHAHAPYGDRSTDEIVDLTRTAVDRLFGLGCRLVLLGCNTAAAAALRRLQQDWLPRAHPDRRILGVLVPMVEAVTAVPWQVEAPLPDRCLDPRAVGVFATRRTVASNAYPHEIAKRAPEIRVVQQACPRLAPAIEADAPEAVLRGIVRASVRGLRRKLGGVWPESVVLGCTHYPLVADHFRALLPERVALLDQPTLVARALQSYLDRHPEFLTRPEHAGRPPVFLTTGDPATVGRLASRFLGAPVRFEALEALAD